MKKLFEVGMYKQSDGKYVKEEFMHNLISYANVFR